MGNECFWTSGNDLAENRKFMWMANGEPFGYTNWWSGEPNNTPNTGSNEHCVELKSIDGKQGWNDRDCRDTLYFVCETDNHWRAALTYAVITVISHSQSFSWWIKAKKIVTANSKNIKRFIKLKETFLWCLLIQNKLHRFGKWRKIVSLCFWATSIYYYIVQLFDLTAIGWMRQMITLGPFNDLLLWNRLQKIYSSEVNLRKWKWIFHCFC